jgi:pimeloyl-ACP methyl ester carboxylesterase
VKVVLLHGLPLDERMWDGQREALQDFDVVAPRLYGRGNSIDGWAGQILDEVEGELVAVGASMGGYCALAMARREPARARGILLAASRAGDDSPERKQQREQTIRDVRERGLTELEDAWGERLGPRTPEEMIAAVEALRDRPDSTGVVRSFSGPLLVVAGDQDDLLSPEEATQLADSAPQGAVVVFEGAGHFVSLDQPDRFNEVIGRFLARWR